MFACSSVTFSDKQQTATLEFADAQHQKLTLKAGARYRLVIAYHAPLNSKLAGFYLVPAFCFFLLWVCLQNACSHRLHVPFV